MSKVKVEDIEFSGGYNLLMLKAEEGNLEEVQRILTELKHIDINTSNKKGYTALALAVKSGQIDVVKLFINSGSDVNAMNNSGQSPLFLACWNNFEHIARILLDNGAEINTIDHRGWTPLMIAAYHGHKLIVRELLSRKADATIQDLFGKKASDRTKDPAVLKMLTNAEMGRSNLFSPPHRQDKSSISQCSPIVSSSDFKNQKGQPVSILKKSGSRQSIGQSKAENDRNQSLLSPQSTGSGIQKHVSSAQQRRAAEPRRTTSQQKIRDSKKDVPTSEKKPIPSIKTNLSEVISPIKANSSLKGQSSPTSSAFERQLFKDDLERVMGDQMNHMCQKIQKIVEQKVALEIPMQMQDFEKDFKRQVEAILRFKAADIFKNLQAVFNLRLKFCLTRLGYDTASLDLGPFLETEAMYEPESISFSKEPLKMYNEKEYKAIQNDVDRLEKSILSQKSLNTGRGFRPESPGSHHCDHTSGVHRHEIKNELLDYLGQEVRSTTEYLLDHSNKKVGELTREESSILYKKIIAEVTDNMEALEDELKHKFEEIITHKMNKVAEVLGGVSPNEFSGIDRVRSADRHHGSDHNQKGSYVGRLPISESRVLKGENDSAGHDNKEDKYASDYDKSLMRESLYSEKRTSEVKSANSRGQDVSVAKDRIQKIKNSLNFMDDEDAEPRHDHHMYEARGSRRERPGSAEEPYEHEHEHEQEQEHEEGEEEEEYEQQRPYRGAEEDHEEEMERVYNPEYMTNLKGEAYSQRSTGEQFNQGSNKNYGSLTKNMKHLASPPQGKAQSITKNNTKGNNIPGHRFTPGGERSEQEALQQYNFSNE